MELVDALAVVTGGGGGLGEVLVVELARLGCDVVIADRDVDAAARVASLVEGRGRRAWPVEADLRHTASVEAVMQVAPAAGTPRVLVNNAGGWSPDEQFPDASPEDWSRTLMLNLESPMRLTQRVLPLMAAVGGGAVVNVASSAGTGTDAYGSPEYAVAKAGLIRLTTSLADLEATHGVRVCCVVPGWIGLPRAHAEVAKLSRERRRALTPLVPPERVVGELVSLLRSGPGGTVAHLPGGEG